MFISIPETFIQMAHDNDYFNGKANEIFFLSADKEFCTGIENTHGLICSGVEDMYDKLPQLFSFGIQSITRTGKIKSWDFLKNFHYPANSAIISDNYIFQKDSLKRDNILKVLFNIMPSQLKETFDLTIFTREVKNLENEYNYINDWLIDKMPYEVNLSIGIVDKGTLGIHDRNIITNNCWYNSGAGFTLFNQTNSDIKIINNTKVFIYPITYVGHYSRSIITENEEGTPVQLNYFEAKNHFKKIWRELPDKIGVHKTFIGKRKNRLLD
jgi:hypothetical protein